MASLKLEQNIKKNGTTRNGRQIYYNKDTKQYFVEDSKPLKSLEEKLQAVLCYLNGISYRAVGRIFGVANTTVRNWVLGIEDIIRAEYGELQEQFDETQEFQDVEIDELFTYFKKKLQNCTFGSLSTELQGKLLATISLKRETLNRAKSC